MATCLIVDDVEVTRFTSEQIVASLGLEALSVASVDEANGILAAKNIDCILLDWHLRKVSGLDYLKALKAGAHARIKVVMFSGVEGEEKRDEALRAGADAFVSKPTTKDKLSQCFKDIGLIH